jgi:hypothetical protein
MDLVRSGGFNTREQKHSDELMTGSVTAFHCTGGKVPNISGRNP